MLASLRSDLSGRAYTSPPNLLAKTLLVRLRYWLANNTYSHLSEVKTHDTTLRKKRVSPTSHAVGPERFHVAQRSLGDSLVGGIDVASRWSREMH